KQGFRGPIYMTEPSADLVEIMLRDAAKIQAEDLKYKQKRHKREGRTGPHPYELLYSESDVEQACELVKSVKFNDSIPVVDGLSAEWIDSGHILGAGSLDLRVGETDSSQPTPLRVVFSGDIGQWNKPLVGDPVRFQQADYLIMESTYGDRLHEDGGDIPSQLERVIKDTIRRGGKVVIPTFAVERAQELMYWFSQLAHQKRIPSIPVFLDSPMAIDVTNIFLRHEDWLDAEARRMIESGEPPLRFPGLRMSRTTKESMAINNVRGPAVILSTSGMCNAGRIKHHLRQYIGDPKSTIVFVGFQSPGTLGREILDKRQEVRIHGQSFAVRAQVEQIFGFSGHADRDGLLHWIDDIFVPPRKTFIVHGEESSALALAARIRERGWNVDVPAYQQVVELDSGPQRSP
ncbi:MAG TPA: MBL fold metallo-hydrolase, partial [Pirellulaceae bacterium]